MISRIYYLNVFQGWIAQWKEMRENKEPLGRPRQIYTGSKSRKYIHLEKR